MSRILVALNGANLKRSILNSAYRCCRDLKMKVDIILVGDDKEAPPALDELLSRLGQARLAPRLFLQHALPVGQAVLAHVRQHKDIYLVLVDALDWGKGIPFRALRQPVGLLGSLAAV